MTDEKSGDGFLARWSRRKREAEEARRGEAATPPASTAEESAANAEPAPGAAPPPELPAVDLSKLPAIEMITAETDLRGFLAPGVPVELTRAALRRAWVVDPKIRDFIEVAENQWDFASSKVPGFGEISVEEARRLVANVLGDRDSEEPPAAEKGADQGSRHAIVKVAEPGDSRPPDEAPTKGETEGDAAPQHKG